VPQAVLANVAQSGAPGSGGHDPADPRARQRGVRRLDTNEQRPAQGASGAPIAQIGRDRLADIGRQRQLLNAVALAMHPELAGAPVDVLQRQGGDLADTQPEPNEHRQDRKVAASADGAPVA
jgi:hypothetical protein